MNLLQIEERSIRNRERLLAIAPPCDPPAPAPKPTPVLTPVDYRFPVQVEQECEDCGGSGRDRGGLDPWDTDDCSACGGTGVERVTRNFLAEAFRIAADPESTRIVDRRHLVAIVQHAREAVAASIRFPEAS